MPDWPYAQLPPAEQLRIHARNQKIREIVEAARIDFGVFVGFVGRDNENRPIRWRPLDELMWTFAEEAWAEGSPVCLMVPTGFGKSTAVALRVAWEVGRNPNLVVPFVTESFDESAKRVDAARAVMKSVAYREVFPDVKILSGREKAGSFRVKRTGHEKEDTVSSHGILTGTGVRSDFTVFDDIVTLKNAVLEPTNRERVYQSLRTTWLSRGRRGGVTRVLAIQTAYHAQDAFARLREDTEAGWRFLVVRAEPPFQALAWEKWVGGRLVEQGEVESPYPAEYLDAEWKRQGPSAAAQSLANRPVDPGICPFKEEMLQGPVPLDPGEYEARTVYADPAGDASTSKSRDTDWCALAAIGRHPERGWELYGFRKLRGKPSEQAAAIADFAVAMAAERVYQDAVRDDALVEATQQELEALGSPLTVEPDKPSGKKEWRIAAALEPALVHKRLSICARHWPELHAEMIAFPAAPHDDGCDAVASCWLKAAGAEASGESDQVVPLALLEAAAAAEPPAGDGVHVGVAVAGYEAEESAAVVLRDRVVVDVVRWPGMDVAEVGRRVAELRARHGEVQEENVHVAGSAAVDHLVDAELEVDGVDLAGDPAGEWEDDVDGMQPCRDRRSELWWVARQLLRAGGLSVPARYVDLWSDLAAPTYEWDAQGRVKVKSREKFHREKERAPVLGDALAVALSRAGGSGLV